MNDFLKKLNLLVRANLRHVLGERQPTVAQSSGALKERLLQFRQRIDEAVRHERRLERQLLQLDNEVQQLDAAADAALARDEIDAARDLITRLKRAEKRRARVAADLRNHRRALDDLRFQVDRLEAAIEQMQQHKRPEAPARKQAILDEIQQAETQYVHVLGQAPETPESQTPVRPQDVEDDLAARLRRLSKPDDSS